MEIIDLKIKFFSILYLLGGLHPLTLLFNACPPKALRQWGWHKPPTSDPQDAPKSDPTSIKSLDFRVDIVHSYFTSLTINTLCIYLFDQVMLRKVFDRLFGVVRVQPDSPRSSPQDLIVLLCHFSRLESLSIPDLE